MNMWVSLVKMHNKSCYVFFTIFFTHKPISIFRPILNLRHTFQLGIVSSLLPIYILVSKRQVAHDLSVSSQNKISTGDHIDVFLCDISLGDGKPTGIDLVRRHFPARQRSRRSSVCSGRIEYCTPVYETGRAYFPCSNPSSRRISTRLSTRR